LLVWLVVSFNSSIAVGNRANGGGATRMDSAAVAIHKGKPDR